LLFSTNKVEANPERLCIDASCNSIATAFLDSAIQVICLRKLPTHAGTNARRRDSHQRHLPHCDCWQTLPRRSLRSVNCKYCYVCAWKPSIAASSIAPLKATPHVSPVSQRRRWHGKSLYEYRAHILTIESPTRFISRPKCNNEDSSPAFVNSLQLIAGDLKWRTQTDRGRSGSMSVIEIHRQLKGAAWMLATLSE